MIAWCFEVEDRFSIISYVFVAEESIEKVKIRTVFIDKDNRIADGFRR